ncbi:hypothetical protein [Microbulbifer sp. GL-2]|uniref:hypothetical protein n=1 Tax=Microbulbifer sp. GL-2 TaxID=2591606 RepID=UPI001161EE07|nr:hypothetical protein [Microbulbifer sp. GL-2]BBM00242.1 hypothetical protein GL2_03160 [Microbulbifer sp. GL-2]
MSMSLFVILALEMEPNIKEINSIEPEIDHVLELSEKIDINNHSGFLPATLDGKATGFEIYIFSVSKAPEPLKSVIPKDIQNGNIYQISFGHNSLEAQAAFATAISMNMRYNGVTIEDQAGSLLSIEQLQSLIASFNE